MTARQFQIFLLEVPEHMRFARIQGRNPRLTGEENRLEIDHAFRESVLAGYRALGAIPVDASGTPEQIAAEIVRRVDQSRPTDGEPAHAARRTTSTALHGMRVAS